MKGKDTISGNCKYYLNDLCYRNYLYSGYGYGLGYLLENAVYLSLKRAGNRVYVGIIKDTEVDFVAIKGEKKLYLQVTLQLTEEPIIEREYHSLKLIQDNFDKYVVSMDDYKIPNNEGIKHVSAWNLDNILKPNYEPDNRHPTLNEAHNYPESFSFKQTQTDKDGNKKYILTAV